jgi:hypothetical protein
MRSIPVPTTFDVFTQDGLRYSYGSLDDPTVLIEGRREIWEASAQNDRSDTAITQVGGLATERYGWLRGTMRDRFDNIVTYRYEHPANAPEVQVAQPILLATRNLMLNAPSRGSNRQTDTDGVTAPGTSA